jgi:SSS family transporter
VHLLDFGVIAVYLLGITWFGARFRTTQKTLKDYFLGGRNAPWWAIGFSIVSAETSTLTVIGTPALSFAGNLGFLQVVLGYLFARIVISVLFLPAYFRGEMFTAYELMLKRFGTRIRKLTAGAFLVLRALAEGVRVFAIAIVVEVMFASLFARLGFGSGEIASIVVIVCLTLFYTFEGGMTAVIWTDVVQMVLYVGGAILSFIVILQLIPGGWPHVVEVASAQDKFRIFDFRFAWTPEFFTRTYSFWAGVIGGCFLTTASHGTEQLMVQRLLAARNERESRAALFGSWVVIFFQFALFLIIGLCLYVYYRDSSIAPPAVLDRIYPEFIWQHLPHGVAGLVIAAILAASMSNLSAALNSLASTTIMDFYKPLVRYDRGEEFYLRLARVATAVWGVLLFLVALVARHWGSVLQAGLSIASIVYGSLLGVFLLGLLTRRTGEIAAMAGMSAGLAVMLYVKFFTPIAWTWYVLIGTAVTFGVGYTGSILFREPVRERVKETHQL